MQAPRGTRHAGNAPRRERAHRFLIYSNHLERHCASLIWLRHLSPSSAAFLIIIKNNESILDILSERTRASHMESILFQKGGCMKNRLEELANILEVSRQTIVSLERGRYNPSIQLPFKISRYFRTTIEEIFIYEED